MENTSCDNGHIHVLPQSVCLGDIIWNEQERSVFSLTKMTCISNGLNGRCLISVKFTCAAISLLALAGCGTIVKSSNASLSGSIAEDAIMLNEAFNKATNAVLLKNILRARDRWPTNYTTLSGIKSSPSIKQSNGLTLSPLGLGNPNGEIGNSKLSPGQGSNTTLSQAIGSANEYNVNPFAAAERSESLLTPIKEILFERYYHGWPKDVVLLMFSSNFNTTAKGGPVAETAGKHKSTEFLFSFHNSGDDFGVVMENLKAALFLSDAELIDYSNKKDSEVIQRILNLDLNLKRDLRLVKSSANDKKNEARACTESNLDVNGIISKEHSFFENLEKFKALTKAEISVVTPSVSEEKNKVGLKICKANATAEKVLKLSPQALERLNLSRKAIIGTDKAGIHNREMSITLRSFEDIVYYLGETLRVAGTSYEPKVAGTCKGQAKVPMFKIATSNEAGSYAISVLHVDQTVKALPKATSYDGSDICLPERTATAMSILNQLLLLNQSPEFLQAPENFFR